MISTDNNTCSSANGNSAQDMSRGNVFNLIFDNNTIHIEIDINGVAWFKAYEIANVLGYSRAIDMTKHLPDYERMCQVGTTVQSGPRANPQEIIMINEYGLYRIIMRATAKKPEVIKFQNWVFYEVLPSIRRFGMYTNPEIRDQLSNDPNLINNLNKQITDYESMVSDYKNQVSQLNTQNAQLQKDLYETQHQYDRVRPDGLINLCYDVSDDNNALVHRYNEMRNELNAFIGDNTCLIDIGTMAKIIFNINNDVGRNRLMQVMRQDGYIMKVNNGHTPTQKSLEAGLMMASVKGNGVTVMITPFGQHYFVRKYKNLQF